MEGGLGYPGDGILYLLTAWCSFLAPHTPHTLPLPDDMSGL